MSATREAKTPTRLAGLMRVVAPLAIRTQRDYQRMVAAIDRLAILDKRSAEQERYLDTLTILVEAYEREHHDIDLKGIDVVEVLTLLLGEHGMSGRELGLLLGQPQLGGKILRGERALSKEHIRILSRHFKVGADLFLGFE